MFRYLYDVLMNISHLPRPTTGGPAPAAAPAAAPDSGLAKA